MTLAIDTTQAPANSNVNGLYVARIGATGVVPPYALSISSQTGANANYQLQAERFGDTAQYAYLLGVPAATGATTINLSVIDSSNTTATASITVTADTALRHMGVGGTIQKRADGMVGSKYHWTPQAIGGTGTYTAWAVTAGALPGGLSADPTTGTVTGTPTASGDFTFTLRVTDSGAATASQQYSIHTEVDRGVTRPAYNAGTGLFVDGNQLYDPNGRPVRMRGMNQNNNGSTGVSQYSKKMGGNILRIFWDETTNDTTSQAVLNQCITDDQIPILCMAGSPGGNASGGTHQTSGSSALPQLGNVLDYLMTTLSATTVGIVNGSGMVNLANEWGPISDTSAVIRDAYLQVKANIVSIVGTTLTFDGSSSVLNATNLGVGRLYLKGMTGASDRMVTVTSATVGGSAGNWTVTLSAGVSGYVSGGVMWAGMAGIARQRYTCPLMIDAMNNGQSYLGMETYAVTVAKSDPMLNTIMSLHVYGNLQAYRCRITSITKGSNTVINFTLPPAFTGNLGTALPWFGGQTLVLYGVQGCPQMNGAQGNVVSSTNSSPSFTYTISLNSSAFSGTPTANTGYLIFSGDYALQISTIAALSAQNICVVLGEFGLGTPPMGQSGAATDASAHVQTLCQVIRAAENSDIGYLVWAEDDGHGGSNNSLFYDFALAGFNPTTNGKAYFGSAANLTGGGQAVVYNPDFSWYTLAQPASFLL